MDVFTRKKCGILGDRAKSGTCDDGWIRANFPWLEVDRARVCSDFVAVIYLLWDVLPMDGSRVGSWDSALIETGPKLRERVHKYSEIVLRWRTDCL